MRRLTVTEVNPAPGTVWTALGIDIDTDEVVQFGVDWRAAQALFQALYEGQDVEVEVEGWQVTGVK